jgi:pimeloyl-ACP methyl ester carboxylesterase
LQEWTPATETARVKIAALSLLLLLALGVAALLGLRAWRQHAAEQAIRIPAPPGIEEGEYVRIGGIDQWIQIRGQDRRNPVLLCLHGGPGGTWLPLTMVFLPWEKAFTVVQWDQRGAGRTLERSGDGIAATMTIDRMTRDGIEVAEYLRRHLGQDRIVVLGHSFGSILGIRMVHERPDLFAAYVGTGQVSSMPRSQQWSYERLLSLARGADDKRAARTLEAIGPPPFDGMDKVEKFFGIMDDHGSDSAQLPAIGRTMLNAPNFSLWDTYQRIRGFTRVPPWTLYRDMLATDLTTQYVEFQVPVYFLQGKDDDVTPAAFAQEYFEHIRAPHKEMALLKGGHFAVWMHADEFLRELETRVKARLPAHAPPSSAGSRIGRPVPG